MDETTSQVIDWLEHLGVPYKRMNGKDLVDHSSYSFHINSKTLNLSNSSFSIDNLDEVTSVWNRKWLDADLAENVVWPQGHNEELRSNVQDHLFAEFSGISRFFHKRLSDKKWLTKPPTLRKHNHKLDQLLIAEEVGLLTPDTLITNMRSEVEAFVEKHESIISKSISNALITPHEDGLYMAYTVTLDKNTVQELPERFYPSLFQSSIDKDFEIRTFYLEGDMYSMAMFSQNDEQTKEDFRRYNFEKPNRSVPFNLPQDIAEKCDAFMKAFDLNCGSLDFIKTTDGQYYFLEVNPTGQFGMVSIPCNYHLEEKVALALKG